MFEFLAHKFHEGGPAVMGSITFVLFGVLVVTLERFIRLWFQYDQKDAPGFLAAVQKLIMNDSIENAIRLCQKARPALVADVLSEGLKRANDTKEEIEYAVDHAILKVTPKVNKFMSLLGSAANIATLLGLLGTIFGLMKSFGAAATATGAEKQTILAEGIAEALTATSYGLSTALLCLLIHGIYSIKQQAILATINHSAAKMLDLLYTRKTKGSVKS